MICSILYYQLFLSAILLPRLVLSNNDTFCNENTNVTAVESNQSSDLDKELIHWLRSNGATINEKLQIRQVDPDDPTSPKGIFATENIEEGEVICEIPMHLMIHHEGELYKNSSDCTTVEATYKAITAEEHMLTPYAKYLLQQPRNYIPLFWSDEGYDFLLQMLGKYLPPQNSDMYELLYTEGIDMCEAPYNDIDDAMMRHARMMVIARSDYAYMIPFYDMFNHKSKRHHIDHEISYLKIQDEQRSKLVAKRAVQAGNEVFNSYNLCDDCDMKEYMGTSEILMTYGFVEKIPLQYPYSQYLFSNHLVTSSYKPSSPHRVKLF